MLAEERFREIQKYVESHGTVTVQAVSYTHLGGIHRCEGYLSCTFKSAGQKNRR